MNTLTSLRAAVLALLLAGGPLTAAPLPSSSLYRLDTVLTDSHGSRFTLADMGGAPVLVAMFYGDCGSACPIVIESLKRTLAALGPDARNLRVLLVSLDPLRDDPPALAKLARSQRLDGGRWRVAVPRDDTDTRRIAAALGIRYRALTGGEIGHTARVTLLGADGTIRAVSTRLEVEPEPALLEAVRAVVGVP
jgi:protein SCO1